MSRADRVTLLIGGVGGAKLAVGLAAILPPERLTIIVNTADDFEHLGLHISPDLDTVLYSLAGVANPETGWGLAGDTFHALGMIAERGGPSWFRLGDRDLGVNLLRAEALQNGKTLSEATEALAESFGVRHRLFPMSDDPVRTWMVTSKGEMGFQEYFVRERWQPVVKQIVYRGIEKARPAPGVLDALKTATLIVMGPSNPYLSIDPILAVPRVRAVIKSASAPCVAVSPIVGGAALKGPAAKLMAELGAEVSAVSVARHYDSLLDGFIIDVVDQSSRAALESRGLRVGTLNTVMSAQSDKAKLAQELLAWAEETLS